MLDLIYFDDIYGKLSICHYPCTFLKFSRFTKYELEGKTKPNQVKINILYNK